jgi:hypothetical protein
VTPKKEIKTRHQPKISAVSLLAGKYGLHPALPAAGTQAVEQPVLQGFSRHLFNIIKHLYDTLPDYLSPPVA